MSASVSLRPLGGGPGGHFAFRAVRTVLFFDTPPESPVPVETGELLHSESGQQKLDGVEFAYDVLDSDPSAWIQCKNHI